jgi:hypothetical protein
VPQAIVFRDAGTIALSSRRSPRVADQPATGSGEFSSAHRHRSPSPVDGPLVRARPEKQRPHPAQVIVRDRLAAYEAERLDQLAHPHPRQPRIVLQQPMDLVLERIQLDGRSGQRNVGGAPDRNAARIVLRARPVRRISSLIETPRTKCSRRSSAQRFTSSNASA